MSEKAAIYGRVSTDIQRDNYSIPTQIAACVKYCKDRGYRLVGDRYVDALTGQDSTEQKGIPAFVDDYTSRELARPAINAALDFLEREKFEILVVHAIDRLARDPYFRQTLEKTFARGGARIEYVLGGYENTAEGEVRKDLDATFAKWENAKRSERVMRGKRAKAERGLFVCGTAPYAYRIDDDAPGGLRVVPEEAEVVRRVFHMYVYQRLSLKAIATKLTEDRVPTISASRIVGVAQVSEGC
ncbi:MAG: recombinase family protein [Anaerolineae bacterium]|nr:recombinase family protein [Anaerolineae bacterium]